jgi:hypothetical protein
VQAKTVMLVVLATTMSLAGCGSGSQVDGSGFTASDRKLAQADLDSLRQTSIPTAFVSITATARTAPAVCRIHLNSTKPKTFKLFLFWVPFSNLAVTKEAIKTTYTWFDATIGQDVRQDVFHIGHAKPDAPKGRVLKSHAGTAFARPSKPCEVLDTGYLRLVG